MQQLTLLAHWLTQAKYSLVFTGAGMSTESGIPDFRSAKNGLWQKFNPDELANVQAIWRNTEEFIAFYQARLKDIRQYHPHAGHQVLAQWQQENQIKTVITQNVDGFHTQAGNTDVIELHGSFNALHCHDCQAPHTVDDFLQGQSQCRCGGIIRPNIILFGEMLPELAFAQAQHHTQQADLFIVLGSSLSVSPANSFPRLAKQQGAKLVIINQDPTELDYLADLCITDIRIKDALITLNQLIKKGA
ncbi:NAD-dependent deacylase [Pseudomonas sp. F1_0610]|uniref:SIR2 family NAD-dependent protein deacylase n=1 Tax=Pseudomonas sp. F1_0610 TaxID=3114284 RepID=UPI0039C4BBD1